MKKCRLKKLVFVLGKGGTGRSTLSAVLGQFSAKQGAKTLILQLSPHDQIRPFFPSSHIADKTTQTYFLAPNLYTVNHNHPRTVQEYFRDTVTSPFFRALIKLKPVHTLFYHLPSLQELFLLGRLYWLLFSDLPRTPTQAFDRVIIDAPATGHSLSLFQSFFAVQKLPIGGFLKTEFKKVHDSLFQTDALSYVITALPHHIVLQETSILLEKVQTLLKVPPSYLFLNQIGIGSDNHLSFPSPSVESVTHPILESWTYRLSFYSFYQKICSSVVPLPYIYSASLLPQKVDFLKILLPVWEKYVYA